MKFLTPYDYQFVVKKLNLVCKVKLVNFMAVYKTSISHLCCLARDEVAFFIVRL